MLAIIVGQRTEMIEAHPSRVAPADYQLCSAQTSSGQQPPLTENLHDSEIRHSICNMCGGTGWFRICQHVISTCMITMTI